MLSRHIPLGRWPLAAILALTFGGLVLATTLAVILVQWRAARDVTVEFVNELVQQSMEELERDLRLRLDPTSALVDDVARLMAAGTVAAGDAAAIEATLAGALSGRADLTALAFVSREGWEIVVRRDEQGRIRTRRLVPATPTLLRASRGAVPAAQWGEITFAPEVGQLVIGVRRAVDRAGRQLGVLLAGAGVAELSELVDELAAEGAETPFILYSPDKVLAHPQIVDFDTPPWPVDTLPEPAEIGDPVMERLGEARPLAAFDRSRPFGITVGLIEPLQTIVATKPLQRYGDVPWTLGVYIPLELLTQTGRPVRIALGIAGGLLLVALGLALLLGRRVGLAIGQATAGAARISALASGEVTPLPRSRIRELDEQARAFNAMLKTILAFETYVPRGLVLHLIGDGGGGNPIRSRQRELAVMFTDIVGFTTLAETLPPAEIAALLNDHFGLLGRAVEAERGTVDKFLGDGMMAFWGAPDRVKQRAARACRAALAIRDAIEADNVARRAAGRPTIRVRIGIHYGPLVVGNIGSPGRINYTVVGDAANIASRLEDFGRRLGLPDAVVIVVSEAVVEEAGPGFLFEELGLVPIQGRNSRIRAFALLGPSPGDGTSEEAAEEDPASAAS